VRRAALALALTLGVAATAVAEPVTVIRNNGASANRVDMVILGDGYTATEIANGTYANHVETFITGVFNETPYSQYRNYFNVRRIDVTSAESGADHPSRGIFKNTALDATYDCSGITRLICVNNSKVNTVLTNSISDPSSRDMIIVLVNDTEYGGSGGSIAVASVNSAAVELILHEAGHSFAFLADEYGGPPPPSCNLVEPSAANATMQTSRSSIKWNHWIDPSTPVPTFSATPGVPGLYQGAVYCDSDMYRPTYDSKMRFLNRPFEQINNEQHVKRVHNFVSPIDSVSPTATTVTVPAGSSQTFSVSTPSPVGHSLAITWTVDGAAVGTSTSFVASNSTMSAGSHTLRVTVADPTALVRNDPSQVLRASREWTVTIVGAGSGLPDLNGDGKLDLLWHHLVSGHIATWFMNGVNRIDVSYLNPPQVADTGWKPVGLADFNADGKTDVLWQYEPTGGLYVWFMNGVTMTGGSWLSHSLPDTRWRVRSIADMNGDGKPDLILQHSVDATMAAWIMNGTTLVDGSLLSPSYPGREWRVAGTGDFNADGKPDLIFQSDRGFLAVWYMNGLVRVGVEYLSPNQIADTRWLVAGVGDVDGDGKPDLILHHTYDGVAGVWLMNGRTMLDGRLFNPAQVPDANWRIVGPR
jgi:hypothetical protein